MATQEALKNFIRQICKEKDLEPHIVAEALEQALLTASKKNLTMYNNARPSIEAETGEFHVYVTKTVTSTVDNPRTDIDIEEARLYIPDVEEGDEVEVEINPEDFGRIAAQSARQVVMQRLRDAERIKVYSEFRDKMGMIATAIVQRFEKRDCIVMIGRAEALLPHFEIPHNARYRFGDRLKVMITDVNLNSKGAVVKVSRTHPDLVLRLFEQEVPEIADRVVKILNVAREPGVRTKISVISNNPDVDPVGACVGMKGSRVQMVVRELENERIDIVPYSHNPMVFIKAALNPVQVKDVVIDEEAKVATVIVDKSQLSLAIGRRGQNARLAARLTGWKIDIQAVEDDFGEEDEEAQHKYLVDFLGQIPNLNEQVRLALLGSRNFSSVEAISEAEPHQLQDVVNLDSPGLWRPIIEGARQYAAALAEMRTEDPEEEGAKSDSEAKPEESDEASEEASAEPTAEATEEQPAPTAEEPSEEKITEAAGDEPATEEAGDADASDAPSEEAAADEASDTPDETSSEDETKPEVPANPS